MADSLQDVVRRQSALLVTSLTVLGIFAGFGCFLALLVVVVWFRPAVVGRGRFVSSCSASVDGGRWRSDRRTVPVHFVVLNSFRGWSVSADDDP